MHSKHYSIYNTLDIESLRRENQNFINEKLKPYDPSHPYKLQSWGIQNQMNKINKKKQEDEKVAKRIQQGPQILDIGVKAKYNDKEYLKQVEQKKLKLKMENENTSQQYQQDGIYFTPSQVKYNIKNSDFYDQMCKSPQERLIKLLKEKELRELEEEKECHVGLSITEMGQLAQSRIEESTQRKVNDMRTKINVQNATKVYAENLSRSMIKDPVYKKRDYVENFKKWQDQKKNGKKIYYGQSSTLNQSSIAFDDDKQAQSFVDLGSDVIDMSVFKQEVMDYLNQSI